MQIDFDDAIQRLIDRGLVEEVKVDGKTLYRLTSLGLAYEDYLENPEIIP